MTRHKLDVNEYVTVVLLAAKVLLIAIHSLPLSEQSVHLSWPNDNLVCSLTAIVSMDAAALNSLYWLSDGVDLNGNTYSNLLNESYLIWPAEYRMYRKFHFTSACVRLVARTWFIVLFFFWLLLLVLLWIWQEFVIHTRGIHLSCNFSRSGSQSMNK